MRVNFEELIVTVKITSKPRTAPFCQNHDSPAFSDPGDPGEFEIESAAFSETETDGVFLIPEGFALDSIIEKLNDSDNFNEKVWEEFWEKENERNFYE